MVGSFGLCHCVATGFVLTASMSMRTRSCMQIESKFAGYIALRTNAMDKLRRIAHSVQKKKLAARGRTSHAGHEEAT